MSKLSKTPVLIGISVAAAAAVVGYFVFFKKSRTELEIEELKHSDFGTRVEDPKKPTLKHAMQAETLKSNSGTVIV